MSVRTLAGVSVAPQRLVGSPELLILSLLQGLTRRPRPRGILRTSGDPLLPTMLEGLTGRFWGRLTCRPPRPKDVSALTAPNRFDPLIPERGSIHVITPALRHRLPEKEGGAVSQQMVAQP